MLNTVADLLKTFLEKEAEVLDQHSIKHGPTIGAMYEELTKDALQRVIPNGQQLSVVSGFAVGADGTKSDQLDCMLIIGKAEEIPRTKTYIVPVDQVVAVVEVKKTLRKDDLKDGYENLRSLRNLRPVKPPALKLSTIYSAFKTVTGHAIEDPKALPADLRLVYDYVMIEAVMPLRVLLGYHGYKTEGGIRRAVEKHVTELVGTHGHGPLTLPNLILTPSCALVKLNGLPWGVSMEDGWLPLLTSSSRHTARLFLDAIWSRLNYRQLASSELFGDDLELDLLQKFIHAKPNAARPGWEYNVFTGMVDNTTVPDTAFWEPVRLSAAETPVVEYLCNVGPIDLRNPPTQFQNSVNLQRIFQRLSESGLVGPFAADPERYDLLTDDCAVARLQDGTAVAGENSSGRLQRWLARTFGPPRT